jgi:two-component system, sensor histidine kinase and response regulator
MKFLYLGLLWGAMAQPAIAQYQAYLAKFHRDFEQSQKTDKKVELLKILLDSIGRATDDVDNVARYKAYLTFVEKFTKRILANPQQQKFLPMAYLAMSSLYRYRDKKLQLEYAYKALEEAKRQHDAFAIRDALSTIASYLYNSGLYDEAIPYMVEREQFLQKDTSNKNPRDYISHLNTMALAYQKTKNYTKAVEYFEKCLQSANQAKDTAWVGLAYGNMAMMHVEEKKYENALAYLKLDAKYSILSKNMGSATHAWMAIANIYQKLGERKKASQCMDTAWALVATIPKEHVKFTLDMVSVYKTAYKFYKENKEFEKLPMYADSLLSFFEKETKSKYNQDLRKIYAQYNVKLKEQDIQNLQQQKNAERWILYLVALVAIAVVALAVVLFKNNRKQLKINTLLNEKQEEIETQNEELNTQKEQLAYQNDTLQQLNATKDKLFSIVSHDFRSPLNALKSTAYLMSREDISPAEVRELTTNVTTQINHTSYFLENLLFWAKSQLKGFRIEAEKFDLQELVQENIELAYPQAEQKKIVLEAQNAETVWIMADKNMTRLVLRNLLSNALKYCRQGDRVTLAYQSRQVDVLVTIQDSGLGMTAEQMHAIFTPYTSSTYGTNQEKGAGLGLLLCKDFVERNGGEIWAESEAGKGSTFYFTLPLAREDNAPPQLDGFAVKDLENGGRLYKL